MGQRQTKKNVDTSVTAKKISTNAIIGQQGVNLVEKVVLEMGFLWYPTGANEAGIDGFIELRDAGTGNVTGFFIPVQVKSTEQQFQAENSEGFDYLCDDRDLNYWLQGNTPVILVRTRPSSGEAYWVSIKNCFDTAEKRKSRKIHFEKGRDRFDQTCKRALLDLAVPKDAGAYFVPPPISETLYSNLLKVHYFPERLYIAETRHRSHEDVWNELRRLGGDYGREWYLKSRQILSFYDLQEYPWNQICEAGTVEEFYTDEWACSDDAEKLRDFVRLLNQCLRRKTWLLDLRYSNQLSCYFFKSTPDLRPRSVSYHSLLQNTSRVVFLGYPSKRDPAKMAYYRHSAFEGYFKRFDGAWYLEITPTYYYTWDGHNLDRYYEDRLKGIKQMERNPAVAGQVVMWADYLRRGGDMFTPQYPFLGFGELMKFDMDVGIDDKMWLRRDRNTLSDGDNGGQKTLPGLGL